MLRCLYNQVRDVVPSVLISSLLSSARFETSYHLSTFIFHPLTSVFRLHPKISKMKFTAIIFATLSATGALAAPAPASDSTNLDGVSQMAAATPQWTITNMKRVCSSNAQSCAWTFGINTHTSPVTLCAFNVTGNPASETNSGVRTCGIYCKSNSSCRPSTGIMLFSSVVDR